jgi:hypothetical protein
VTRARRGTSRALAWLALLVPLAASAQAPLPFGDAPVRLEAEHVVATALGPLPDAVPIAPGRLSARSVGRRRAIAMLHAWLDGVLRASAATPLRVRDLHDAIDRHADLRRVRSRSDGSAVVELVVPLSALRALGCDGGLPWCD